MKTSISTLTCLLLALAACTEPVERPSDTGGDDINESCETHEGCESKICQEDKLCKSKDDVIYVATDGSTDFDCGRFGSPCASIQQAIDIAHQNLTTISIASGTYQELFVVEDKKIELIGTGSPKILMAGATGGDCSGENNVCKIKGRGDYELLIHNLVFESFSQNKAIEFDAGDSNKVALKVFDSMFLGEMFTGTTKPLLIRSNADLSQTTFEQITLRLYDSPSFANNIKMNSVRFIRSQLYVTHANFQLSNSFVVDTTFLLDIADTPLLELENELETTNRASEQTIDFSTLASTGVHSASVTWNCSIDVPLKVRNSIIYGPPNNPTEINIGGCDIENSLLSAGSSYGTNNFYLDPLFVNHADGDFRLQADSPAIDRLRGPFDIDFDFEGDPRPSGEGYDVGADEYVP